MGGVQLLTAIQERKEGFSIRKLDPALEKLGEQCWAGRRISEKERRVGSSSQGSALLPAPLPPSGQRRPRSSFLILSEVKPIPLLILSFI